jgi:hypothetical protein
VPAALGLARGELAGLDRDPSGLAGRGVLRQRRRRDVERRELVHHPGDPLGVGLLVDAVEAGDPLALDQLRDLFVGQDHQLLDQPVGLGLGDGLGCGHVPLVVEAEVGLGAVHLELGAGAALRQCRGGSARERDRLGHVPGRLRAAGEDLIELVVVQARVRADPAAVEAR